MRIDKRGGGISIFVREVFICKKLDHISYCLEEIESLFLEIKYDNNSILLIGTFYRPPRYCTDLFIDKVSEILSRIRITKYRRVIICRDYN